MLTVAQGALRGRKITLPDRSIVRPMGQRMREAVFNILQHRYSVVWPEVQVLDSFSGSGSLGLEALSRGAQKVCFVDRVLENLENTKKVAGHLVHNVLCLCNDATQLYTTPYKAQVGFVDPPFGKGFLKQGVAACANNMDPDGVIVVQKETSEILEVPSDWEVESSRTYTYKTVCFLKQVSKEKETL